MLHSKDIAKSNKLSGSVSRPFLHSKSGLQFRNFLSDLFSRLVSASSYFTNTRFTDVVVAEKGRHTQRTWHHAAALEMWFSAKSKLLAAMLAHHESKVSTISSALSRING